MILLDGQQTDSPLLDDRGLAYGDGLFETIALSHGRLLAWSAHMTRLERGCAALGLPAPAWAQVQADVEQLRDGRSEGVVKIIITRGSGGRGYRPPATVRSRRIVSLHDMPQDLGPDASVAVSTWVCQQRLALNPQLAGIKHLNRIEQVLASAEWPSPEHFEGLMLDVDGRLIEGIRSNLFAVRGQHLLTPDLHRAGIAGIVRQAIIEAAPRFGFSVHIGAMDVAGLASVEELFLCNSVMGLRRVGRIDRANDVLNLPSRGVAMSLGHALRAAQIIP